jgi:hypothetical protein
VQTEGRVQTEERVQAEQRAQERAGADGVARAALAEQRAQERAERRGEAETPETAGAQALAPTTRAPRPRRLA